MHISLSIGSVLAEGKNIKENSTATALAELPLQDKSLELPLFFFFFKYTVTNVLFIYECKTMQQPLGFVFFLSTYLFFFLWIQTNKINLPQLPMFSWQNKIFTHPLEILTNTVIIHRYLNSALGPKLSHKGKVPGRSVLSWLSFGCQLCCGHCYSWNMSFSSSGSFIFPKTKIWGWELASTDNSHWFLDIAWTLLPLQPTSTGLNRAFSNEPYMAHSGTQKTCRATRN